jgi:hypothetical protein
MRLVINDIDLSGFTEANHYTVTRKNIYEKEASEQNRSAVGCKYEISASLTGIPDDVASAVNAQMLSPTCNVEFTLPHGSESETLTMVFSRPEITLTSVSSMSDGDYWDEEIRLQSENVYSDDCL